MKRTLLLILLLSLVSVSSFADSIGALSVEENTVYTLEEMFQYSYEDEIMAKAEYDYIIETFDAQRPFSNIVKAEERHIEWVLELYEIYQFVIPEVVSNEFVVKPESLSESFELGVVAEVNNIEMYKQFLSQDLPDDVRDTFDRLMKSSENHLKSFSRNRRW